jgi:hypothetical protein
VRSEVASLPPSLAVRAGRASYSAPMPVSSTPLHPLLSRTGQALIWFWALLGLILIMPGPLRSRLRRIDDGEGGAPRATAGGAPGLPAPRPAAGRGDDGPAAPADLELIQDPQGNLRPFFEALARTAARQPGALTRVLHYGDSLIDQDLITASLRQRLQKRFGDGGHGFVLAAKAWRWYSHAGVGLTEQSDAWEHFRLVGGKARDGRLGLGCAAVEAHGRAWLQLQVTAGQADKLQVFFQRAPGGGELEVLVDGASAAQLSALSDQPLSGVHELDLKGTPQRLRLVAQGKVRVFGVALERRGPGLTWENLALLSARLPELGHLEAKHWTEQLAARRPHLVVLQFGANDSMNFGGDLADYTRRSEGALRKLRAAVPPKTSCLVLGPLDRLVRDAHGLHSPAVVRKVSDAQRQAALDAGCAFWDSQRAMGGAGAMRRWLKQGLAVADMVHLSGRGSQLFAEILERALVHGFEQQQSGAGGAPKARSRAVQ